MQQTPDDLAAERQQSDGAGDLSADQVAQYLSRNPDFLVDHPQLLDNLAAPTRWSGDGVVDIQRFMLERLRGEVDHLRNCAEELIETGRNNLSSQMRAHSAVLAVLGATDAESLVRTVADDFPLLLDIDVAVLAFETGETARLPTQDGLRALPPGAVDDLLQGGDDVLLVREYQDAPNLFGAAAGLVRSAALARLRPGRQVPDGLLALGSRGHNTFHPGQGSELVVFLARVVERCVLRWMDETP